MSCSAIFEKIFRILVILAVIIMLVGCVTSNRTVSRYMRLVKSHELYSADSLWRGYTYPQGFGYQHGTRYVGLASEYGEGYFIDKAGERFPAFIKFFANGGNMAFELYDYDNKYPYVLRDYDKVSLHVLANNQTAESAGLSKNYVSNLGRISCLVEDNHRLVLGGDKAFRVMSEYGFVRFNFEISDEYGERIRTYVFDIDCWNFPVVYKNWFSLN